MPRCISSFLVVTVALMMLPAAGHTQSDMYGQLAGNYAIRGWSPDNTTDAPDYAGWATLETWGSVLRYRGYMDGMTYAGAGIFDDLGQTLSLSFTNVTGSERGVTVLRFVKGKFEGVWTMDNGGDGTLGREVWTKKE